jgi:enediyne core biosynthesis thioesterase
MKQAFVYNHVVGFEETNLVGNVYFANIIKWQGRCREMFIKEYAPDVLDELYKDLSLVTVNVTADFYKEIFAFDEVKIRMFLSDQVQNRVTMNFEYWRSLDDGNEELVAVGKQQIASLRKAGEIYIASPLPESFIQALSQY